MTRIRRTSAPSADNPASVNSPNLDFPGPSALAGSRNLRGLATISGGAGDQHICEAAITAAGTGVHAICESGSATGRTAQLTTSWPRALTENAPVGVVLQFRFPVEGWTATAH